MQIGGCLFLTRETILEDGEAYLWDFEKGYLGHFYSPVKE